MTSKAFARFETAAKANQFLNTHISCFTAPFVNFLSRESECVQRSAMWIVFPDLELRDALVRLFV